MAPGAPCRPRQPDGTNPTAPLAEPLPDASAGTALTRAEGRAYDLGTREGAEGGTPDHC